MAIDKTPLNPRSHRRRSRRRSSLPRNAMMPPPAPGTSSGNTSGRRGRPPGRPSRRSIEPGVPYTGHRTDTCGLRPRRLAEGPPQPLSFAETRDRQQSDRGSGPSAADAVDAQARGRRTEQPDLAAQLVIAEAALAAPNGGWPLTAALCADLTLPWLRSVMEMAFTAGPMALLDRLAMPAAPVRTRRPTLGG
jgi:hypothetical protein